MSQFQGFYIFLFLLTMLIRLPIVVLYNHKPSQKFYERCQGVEWFRQDIVDALFHACVVSKAVICMQPPGQQVALDGGGLG